MIQCTITHKASHNQTITTHSNNQLSLIIWKIEKSIKMEEEDALEQEVDDVTFRTLDLDAEYKKMVATIIQDELEEEEEEEGSMTNQWGGSRPGKSGNKREGLCQGIQ